MNDLETRLAETLRLHADAADVRPDPDFVVTLVERRDGSDGASSAPRRLVLAFAVAASLIVGVVVLVAINRNDQRRGPEAPATSVTPEPSTTQPPTTEPSTTSSTVAAEVLTPGEAAAIDSELLPYWETVGVGSTPSERFDESVRVGAAVTDCMEQAGWSYTPYDLSDGPPEDARLSRSEFGERYGFGIARSFSSRPAWWPSTRPVGDSEPEIADPNAAYLASLNITDQEAFRAALGGDAGCRAVGDRSVYGDRPTDDPDVADRFVPLFLGASGDPAVAQATVAWAECMQAKDPSRQFTIPDAIDSELRNEFMSRWASVRVRVLLETEGNETNVHTDAWLVLKDAGPPAEDNGDGTGYLSIVDPDRIPDDELNRFAADEVRLWLADQKCRGDSGYRAAVREYYQHMLDTLRTEFPEVFVADPNP